MVPFGFKGPSVAEALKLLKEGKTLEGVAIDFREAKVEALEAFFACRCLFWPLLLCLLALLPYLREETEAPKR